MVTTTRTAAEAWAELSKHHGFELQVVGTGTTSGPRDVAAALPLSEPHLTVRAAPTVWGDLLVDDPAGLLATTSHVAIEVIGGFPRLSVQHAPTPQAGEGRKLPLVDAIADSGVVGSEHNPIAFAFRQCKGENLLASGRMDPRTGGPWTAVASIAPNSDTASPMEHGAHLADPARSTTREAEVTPCR